MANKKPDRICSDCIHFKACQSWTSGILENTDARPCRNYETIVDSNAYYIGQVDADRRNKPMKPLYRVKESCVHAPRFCPVCQKMVDILTDSYCPYCGQALDWGEDS